MKRWYIGINDIYYSSVLGLEEAPWHIFAIERIGFWFCDIVPRIPLPKIKIVRNGEETNLKEWYGDIQQIYHAFVCDPIFQWCQKRINVISISLPFFFLKEYFPDEFKDCDYEDAVKERKMHSELLSQVVKDLMENEEKDVQLAIKKFLNAEK